MVVACVSLSQAGVASAAPTLIRVKQDGTGDFTTIKAALVVASPGDIIEIQDSATYSEGTIYINVNNLVLRAQAGQTPLVGGGGAVPNIILIDADYVTIEGLEVAYGTADLIYQENLHTGTVVRNCVVHDSTGDEAIQLKYAVNAIVESNLTYNTREDGVSLAYSVGGIIRKNRIENSESQNGAIYVYNSENIIIEGNYIWNSVAANAIKIYKMENNGTSVIRRNVIWGNYFAKNLENEGRLKYSQDGNAIQLYVPFEKQNESAQLIIEHNTIDNNTSARAGHGIYWGQRTLSGVLAATPIYIRNNIISNNKGWGIWTENLSARPADVAGAGVINYNDVYNNAAGAIRNVLAAVLVDNNISEDPLFVDPPYDYHLQAGSPAIDAGMDVGLPYEGSAPDMGAFEFDNTPPAAPSLIWPENGAKLLDNTPTFMWTSVSDPSGVTYEIEIDDDEDFSSPVYSGADLTGTTLELPNEYALALGKYYWHVRAKDGASNISDWSGEWNFTVVPIGTIGVLLMPILMLLPFALVLRRQNRRYNY
jgi:parallel beta-helix repeat protein